MSSNSNLSVCETTCEMKVIVPKFLVLPLVSMCSVKCQPSQPFSPPHSQLQSQSSLQPSGSPCALRLAPACCCSAPPWPCLAVASSSSALALASATTAAGKRASSATWMPKLRSHAPSCFVFEDETAAAAAAAAAAAGGHYHGERERQRLG